jgi:iron complex outermembrane receptor protein
MKRIWYQLIWFCLLVSTRIVAQQRNKDSLQLNADSSLSEVVVTAFQSKVQWKDAPAAVAFVSTKELQLQNINNFLPAFNMVSGVRLEERSPASYRISIRGSTLRSPFGVRNVKVYWNDIPLSDGSGNTYFNLIDVNEISSAEIIKGPAASMYGAGTGGVVLLQSKINNQIKDAVTANMWYGSFASFNENIGWNHTIKNLSSSLMQLHQQSNGYREQTASAKNTVQWLGNYQTKKSSFNFIIFYTDLYYQTPGGLTKAQMLQDPQQARPAAGSIPGAVQQKAAVYNKTIFGGIHQEYKINQYLSTETSLVLNHTAYTNAAIANYEERDETNSGLKTQLIYRKQVKKIFFQWNTGVEWLYNHSGIDVSGNNAGKKDTLQYKDDVFANQWFVFMQARMNVGKLFVDAGVSLNEQDYHYKRLSGALMNNYANYGHQMLTPRFSVLYKINQTLSWYAIAASGFSPPSLAEVHPSDGLFHDNLLPESGWNIEAGFKGNIFNNNLSFDVVAYHFFLNNAIVRRNNAAGLEYFVNAGNATENGAEFSVKAKLFENNKTLLRLVNVQTGYSYQPYYFGVYQQGTTDYSGNTITGVPRNIFAVSVNAEFIKHFYCNISFNANAAVPLNDANDEYANAYHLLQLKMGKHIQMNKAALHVFLGADNLLNEVYSLGNDINATGRRFYNPAAERNFYGGVGVRF